MPRPYDGVQWERFPWPEAVTWFGRGLGAAHLGRQADAERALNRLGELEQAADRSGEEAYERSLALYPNRLNGMLGAARAAQALDDGETAKGYYAALVKTTVRDAQRAGLKEASSYLHASTN